ncbi:PHD finger protein 10-like isoform X2 [Agrilus planipennis]|uniref:PHD finger protein 10-like isoform X2 n=1 Tax=Agrilus planipennis TaxID=224129 RepID=A0A7F5RN77_AGRPL|nr:PHD finger protein 10-like isoform X2 [Agrilus planipennis]
MRAKKVFDPSDNNIPRKRGRPTGSINKTVDRHSKHTSSTELRPDSRMGNIREQGGVCSVCHNNARVSNDRFVSCRECSNKAHFSCLNGDDNMMLRMYPDNTWQCPHCKTCVICFETSDAGSLIVCSICADAYHATCHQPRITEKIRNGMKWLCINCQMPEQLAINDIQSHVITGDRDKIIINGIHRKSPSPSVSGNSSPLYRSLQPSPTPPTLSPQANRNGEISPDFKSNLSDSQSLKDLDLEEHIDPTIPDATNWSYEDVYNYFARYFPNEAKVFKDQVRRDSRIAFSLFI